MRALFICHGESEGPGRLGDELAGRGYDVARHDIGAGPWPTLDGVDLVAVMGAPYSVYDTDPVYEIDTELDFLRTAFDRDVPIIGVCFGAQALAAALGGTVERAPRPEIGWYHVDSDEAWLAPGPWLQWHGDRFTPPPGAREIARSPVASQAYVIGRCLAVQFHPEVDTAIVADWLDGRSRADDEFAAAGADPDEIVARAPAATAANREPLSRIVTRFLQLARHADA